MNELSKLFTDVTVIATLIAVLCADRAGGIREARSADDVQSRCAGRAAACSSERTRKLGLRHPAHLLAAL